MESAPSFHQLWIAQGGWWSSPARREAGLTLNLNEAADPISLGPGGNGTPLALLSTKLPHTRMSCTSTLLTYPSTLRPLMLRKFSTALLAVSVLAPATYAQGPIERAGQGLDRAGK